MVAFNKAKGTAQKNNIEQYQMRNGDNAVRFVGDLLARYVYWIEGENKTGFVSFILTFVVLGLTLFSVLTLPKVQNLR
jgi:hypothetical protein